MRIRAKIALAALLGLVQCRPAPGSPPPSATARAEPEHAPAAPRLVVLLVIDQLPSWSFDPQHRALSGGIARLVREGAYWPRARYPYATTNTAPGHATLATGTTPSVHGIVANGWYDRAQGRRIDVDDDPTAPTIDPRNGAASGEGRSNVRLEAPGIAEALHAAHPTGRAIAIGWKSRAAMLVLGQRADLPLWFDTDAAAMTTSTAFTQALPRWVTDFARAHPAPADIPPWTPLDDRVAALASHPDDAPDEGNPQKMGRVFPHSLAGTHPRMWALGATPAANTLLVDAAIAALEGEALGADDAPDVLAITFSSHDYAGHAWCQESWERVDHLLRIDRDLTRLFDALDARLGADGWAAVLTSDHGTIPSRTRIREAGHTPTLARIETIAEAAKKAAAAVLGPGEWVLGVSPLGVAMTHAFHGRDAAERGRTLDAIVAAVRREPLAFVERSDALVDACDGDGTPALVCRSLFPARSVDIYTVPLQWGVIDDTGDECSVHGTPWAYDREVPIIVRGPGFVAGRRDEQPSTLTVAPTLAALLGVPPPAYATSAPLSPAPQ